MPDFLLELGLEEVPARMLPAAQAELQARVLALIARERLAATASPEADSFSTPRRLAVRVRGLHARQPDQSEDLQGPAVKIAFKDGAPTPAAHAFAKKAGVAVEALRTVATPKGDYLAATSVRPGRVTAELLAELLPREIAAIAWPKTMYWRAGKPERFVRPLQWIAALLDDAVVPLAFAGISAGRTSRGHRVLHGAAPVEIAVPASYVDALKAAYVNADVEARRHTIRKALDRACRAIPQTAEGPGGLRWREDHALVDKMTHLTEWPSVVAGSFDPAYLTLPQEVLVTVMRDHQNYFAVEDSTGRLAPHFLAVLNTATDPEGEAIIRHGNERVLRARFNDARFFWEFDQRVPLEGRVVMLENVTFQKDLGSYAAKSARVAALAATLAEKVTGIDTNALAAAARLAKTDLTTELVKEFTELQGEIGGLYARHQGLPEATADAIYDHYRPTSMEDRIPRTVEAQVLALADKADTIAGMFSLGLEPTGSRDPLALRRAANGIVKIVAQSALPHTLAEIAQAACNSFNQPGLAARVQGFLVERLDFYLREAGGASPEVAKAVLAVGQDDPRDALARAEAVMAMRGSADFAAVAAAFKRMQNILAQAGAQGAEPAASVDPAAFADDTERTLALEAGLLAARVASDRASANYRAALEAIATLRPAVDRFFEAVMVMDPDLALRRNRLALLTRILADFGGIADFAEIAIAG